MSQHMAEELCDKNWVLQKLYILYIIYYYISMDSILGGLSFRNLENLDGS